MSAPVQFDVYAVSGAASATIVQTKSSGIVTSGGLSLAVTLDTTPTVGNTLVAAYTCSTDNSPTWSDGWTLVRKDGPTSLGGYDGQVIEVRKKTVESGDTGCTITDDVSLGNAYCLDVVEVSGVGGTVEDSDTAESAGTTISVPSVTAAGAAALLAFHTRITSASPRNTPTNWTQEESSWQDLGDSLLTATFSRIVTTGGTYGGETFAGGVESGNSAIVTVVALAASGAPSFLATLDNAFDKEFRVELDGTGMGSFKINRHEAEATAAILGDGLDDLRYVKVRIPDVSDDPIFGFWLEAGDFKLLDPNEDGAEVLTFGGRGPLAYLDRAVMWSESYITGGHDPYGGLWRLHDAGTGTKPGQMLRRIIEEAQDPDRPQEPLPLLTIDFDYTNDSNGTAWAASTATAEFAAQIGESLLSVTGRLIGTRAITVQMSPDFELSGYNDFGRDLGGTAFGTAVVRFEAGENIAEPGIRRQMVPTRVATHLLVTGEGDNYGTATLGTAVSRVTREGFVSAFGSATATLNAIGTATINERLQRAESVAVPITPGTAATSGLYLPGPEGTNGHFWVGDTVCLHTGSGDFDYNEQDFEVAAIEVKESDAAVLGADLDITVELGSTTIIPSSSSSITTVLSSSTGGGSGSIPPHTHPGGAVVSFGTAAITLGTAATAGSAVTSLRTDATIVAFGTALPSALGTAASAGTAAFAARLDHAHPGVVFLDEGSAIGTAAFVNITGSGGTASYSGGTVTIDIASGGGGGGGSAVWYDEGVLAGTAAIVNVTGSGGTVTVSGGTATINISGGTAASSIVVQDEGSTIGTATVLNFTGSGGTASYSGGTATVDISGGGASDVVQVASGAGSVRIPGISASPDIVPASPDADNDEFDSTDTSDPITGWTTLGTLDALNTNSTALSHLYLRKAAVNATRVDGIYKAQTPPFTVTAKLAAHTCRGNFSRAGIFIGEATPGNLETCALVFATSPSDGVRGEVLDMASPTSFTATVATTVIGPTSMSLAIHPYLRIVVASSTNVTYQISMDGLFWQSISASRNPGFTVGSAGLFVNPQNASLDVEALFDWIRFT